MKHTQSLPEPTANALAHSEKLITRMRDEIEKNHGAITFRRYMEMALYEPGLGYYVAGTHKIGVEGDFVTAPEISPLFSRCIATQIINYFSQKGQNRGRCASTPLSRTASNNAILELGAGSGTMAVDILLELEKQGNLPEHYYILDLSPDLKQRQRETFEKQIPHLLNRISWLDLLPENFDGVILGNEVLDAMPVDVFTQQEDKVFEHHVIWEENQLREQLRSANSSLKNQALSLSIPYEATPYTSEINPNLSAWFKALNQTMKSGLIVLIDYGYARKEYYQAERNKGTLICHFQHLVNEAPLYYPGLQDITANVDFTAVAEAADDADFSVAGYTTQAAFLSNNNLENHYTEALKNKPVDQYKLAQQVRTLSLPSEMGEHFKVIALTKNHSETLLGFSIGDQRHLL